MASEASTIVEITGDKAKVRDALAPATIGMKTLADLAQHAADEKVRLDAALALLGRL